MRGRWLLVMLGLVLGASVALDAQQSGTTVSRPGTVPQEGVTGPRDMPRPSKGTARLRGLVVGGENGGPLRRAMVQLSGDGLQEGRATTTNEEGRWEIRDLPAGRYQITANKAGYVSLNYGQRRAFEQGKPLELREGQTVENVNFNLPRGSAISGRVTDEFGEPVADVMISAQRYRYIGGRRRLTPVSRPASTDDGGNFRLYGLAPGDYYLSAAPMGFSFGQSSDDGTGYAPTYLSRHGERTAGRQSDGRHRRRSLRAGVLACSDSHCKNYRHRRGLARPADGRCVRLGHRATGRQFQHVDGCGEPGAR